MTRPGAWLAARLSVLAAESSQPDRFTRGRQYARDAAVTGLEVEVQTVRAQVQGSVARPYEVEIRWVPVHRPGPVPRRNEVHTRCTCPDPVGCCKHAVAVLLALADAVGDDPDLLDDWRGPDEHWAQLPEAPPDAGLASTSASGGGAASGQVAAHPALLEFFGERHADGGGRAAAGAIWPAVLAGLERLRPGERPAPEHPVEPLLARAVDDAAAELQRLLG